MLSIIVFLPLLGSIAILAIPKERAATVKAFTLAVSLLVLVLALALVAQFKIGQEGMQFVEKIPWVRSIGIQYYLGIDGISLPMIFLTALLTFLAALASWKVEHRVKGFFALLLLLETGMLGVFSALDFILFYIFWEVVLVPMYFLIGIWGGPRREYAAIKFFLYTLFGSVIMLVGILTLYFSSGLHTFDMLAMTKVKFSHTLQLLVFPALALGFAIKVPIFPFHTWLPDAHVEAPTAVSALLAGVLLKMGAYGFLRISLPILPEGHQRYAPVIIGLAIVGIIYGACVAMIQRDLKRLVAYSSVSHMGYVMLAIGVATPAALDGAVLQMFNHGTITGMLFLLVGLIYERTHTREIAKLGGLAIKIPILAAILGFASLASLGLPGLSGFVGEFLILLGFFQKFKLLTLIPAMGIVLTAAYLLWMLQRVNMGSLPSEYQDISDANGRELLTLVPLMAVIILVGVYPLPLLKIIGQGVSAIISIMGGSTIAFGYFGP